MLKLSIAFYLFAIALIAQNNKGTQAKPVQVLFPVAATDAILLIHPDGTTQALTLATSQFCITPDFILQLCQTPAAPPPVFALSFKKTLQTPASDGSYTFLVTANSGQPLITYDPQQWITVHRNGLEQTAGLDYNISTAQASPTSVNVILQPIGPAWAGDVVSVRWVQ
jgi:hypothetical protein